MKRFYFQVTSVDPPLIVFILPNKDFPLRDIQFRARYLQRQHDLRSRHLALGSRSLIHAIPLDSDRSGKQAGQRPNDSPPHFRPSHVKRIRTGKKRPPPAASCRYRCGLLQCDPREDSLGEIR